MSNKHKKIVHLIFSFTVGGAENLLVDLINRQAQKFSVRLIIVNRYCSEALLEQLHPAVKVTRINRSSGSRSPLKIVWINLLLAFLRPNIIHCHNHNIINLVFSQRHKTILTVHDVNTETKNLPKYGQLIAISDAVKEDVESRNTKCKNVKTVHNGIDFTKIETRQNSGTGRMVKLLQVSRLVHEKKGQDVLLRAMNRLVNTLGQCIELTLVGAGESKEYLQELIYAYNLQHHVTISDDKNRSWIYPNLKNFDMLIQPSRYEGFGLTIVEGMAACLPVIASNLDGPREILCDGRFGYLFESEDADGLAGKIMEVIDNYRNGTMGRQTTLAYQHGSKYFSLPTMVKGYSDAYRNMDSWQPKRKVAML